MSHRIRPSFIIVLILIFSGWARSQQPAPVKKNSPEVEAMRAKAWIFSPKPNWPRPYWKDREKKQQTLGVG